MNGSIRTLLASTIALILSGAAVAQELSATPATTSPSTVPTIEDFASEPATVDVAIAPDGRHVATVRLMEGATYLTVIDLTDETAKPIAAKLGDVRVYGLKWVNNDRLIYSAGSNDIGLDYKRGRLILTGVPQLFAINRDLEGNMLFFGGDAYQM